MTVNDAVSTISGGSLSGYGVAVGNSGTGTLTQSGGTNTVSQMFLGYNSGDSGTYILSGTGQLQVSGFQQYVGYSGTGNVIQSGGTLAQPNAAIYIPGSSNVYLFLGDNASGSGTYSLSGSGVVSVFQESMGYYGTGTFTQSGGTNVAAYLISETSPVAVAPTTSAGPGS